MDERIKIGSNMRLRRNDVLSFYKVLLIVPETILYGLIYEPMAAYCSSLFSRNVESYFNLTNFHSFWAGLEYKGQDVRWW